MKLSAQEKALVEQNLGLVNVHIRRCVSLPGGPRRDREYDDLFQEGSIALMQAARTYDPKRHGPFAAYAIPRIHHAVSIALYERFSTVRVPAKSVKRAKQRRQEPGDSDRHRPEPALVDTRSLGDGEPSLAGSAGVRHRPAQTPGLAGRPWARRGRTVADAMRDLYEAAVREAARRVIEAGRGRSDRAELIRRFVDERLLVPEASSRTAKRQLARDFDCSIGRVQNCEEVLRSEIRRLLEAGDDFDALQRLARGDADGYGATLDEADAARVERQGVEGFATRFARLEPARQAHVLRQLVSATTGSLAGFARRLYAGLDTPGRMRILGEMDQGDGRA